MKDDKILIVDDSRSMCAILEDMLRNGGYNRITSVHNGDDALVEYERLKPALVLLDIIMPGQNGMDVLKELGGKTKVIILSAVGQDSIVKEAKKFGAKDYLVKPLEASEVLRKVASVLP